MDTEDLLPRLALFGGLVAAIIMYRRRRTVKLKNVQAELAAVPGAAMDAAAGAAKAGGEIADKGQSMIESLLDNVAEQALKELKTVLKDGLRRLEKTVDDLYRAPRTARRKPMRLGRERGSVHYSVCSSVADVSPLPEPDSRHSPVCPPLLCTSVMSVIRTPRSIALIMS